MHERRMRRGESEESEESKESEESEETGQPVPPRDGIEYCYGRERTANST